MFGITLVTFFVIQLAQIKPAVVSSELNPKISASARERIHKLYGFDKPVIIRYFEWVKRTLLLDFGKSFVDGRPVIKRISDRLPVTLGIQLISLVLIFVIGIPIGVWSAIREDSPLDHLISVFLFIWFSVPTFWLALIAMDIFGVQLRVLPVSGIRSLDFRYLTFLGKIWDIAHHLILPVCVGVAGSLVGISRYTRSQMCEAIHQDYVRTARSKGLPENIVIYKHALKNALLPIITIIGLSLPGLIGGSVIFESIFAIPGMGRLFFDSVMAGDVPTIMGILTLGSVLTLVGNLLSDILYAVVDPRIRVGE